MPLRDRNHYLTVLASPLQAAQLLSTPLPLDYRIIHHTFSRLCLPAHLPSLGHERAWSAIVLKCLSLGMITLCAPCAPVSLLLFMRSVRLVRPLARYIVCALCTFLLRRFFLLCANF